MSQLPGNEFHADARLTLNGVKEARAIPSNQAMYKLGIAQVQATLALTHEQRTANLQAERAWAANQGDGDMLYGLTSKIQTRLGEVR